MGLFHVLLAIAFPLRLVGTWGIFAVVHWGRVGVLVVDMAVSLLLRGPAKRIVFAAFFGTFPRTRVRLLVLGQIAGPFEVFSTLAALLLSHRGGRLRGQLAFARSSSHRSMDRIVVGQPVAGGTF